MDITVQFIHKLTSSSMGSWTLPVPKDYEVESIILPDGIESKDGFSFEVPDQLVGVPLTFGLILRRTVPYGSEGK